MAGPQNHQTPPEFIEAIKARFGPIVFDLAAEKGVAHSPEYFDESDDSLSQPWGEIYKTICPDRSGWMWLNPPFSGGPRGEDEKARSIEDWAKHCWFESQRGARILFLVPASVDANWWVRWVNGKGRDEAVLGRMRFVGQSDPFMKPLSLIAYEFGVYGGNGGAWRWKQWVPDEFRHLLRKRNGDE